MSSGRGGRGRPAAAGSPASEFELCQPWARFCADGQAAPRDAKDGSRAVRPSDWSDASDWSDGRCRPSSAARFAFSAAAASASGFCGGGGAGAAAGGGAA